MVSIAGSLAESASKLSQRALAAHNADNFQEFHLFAGIALEHALKAVLAEINPVFIAACDFKSMRLIWKQRDNVADIATEVNTITVTEAIKRVKEFTSVDEPLKLKMEKILSCRNGMAHIGHHGPGNTNEALANFVDCIDFLLCSEDLFLCESHDEFWGLHNIKSVEEILQQKRSELELSVDNRIQTAKGRFEIVTKLEGTATVVDNLISSVHPKSNDLNLLLADCPACNQHEAWLRGTNQVEVDVSFEDGYPAGGYYVEFRAQSLNCDSCGLSLASSRELETAGVPIVQRNPYLKPEDLPDFNKDDW